MNLFKNQLNQEDLHNINKGWSIDKEQIHISIKGCEFDFDYQYKIFISV